MSMSEYDEAVDMAARALDDLENPKRKTMGGAGKRPATSVSRRRVNTMLSSLSAAGYALVKREATDAMVDAARCAVGYSIKHPYRSISNAAIVAGEIKGGE
jgi:hypothetical protein